MVYPVPNASCALKGIYHPGLTRQQSAVLFQPRPICVRASFLIHSRVSFPHSFCQTRNLIKNGFTPWPSKLSGSVHPLTLHLFLHPVLGPCCVLFLPRISEVMRKEKSRGSQRYITGWLAFPRPSSNKTSVAQHAKVKRFKRESQPHQPPQNVNNNRLKQTVHRVDMQRDMRS